MRITQPQLFLCHSSLDKAFVRSLALELSEVGVHVWLDEWELAVGDSLIDCIGRALKSCAYIGVVMSPNSMSSRWCQEELKIALSREMSAGQRIVLPLLHRTVELPPFLLDRLYIDFRRRRYSAIAELAAFLHGIERQTVTVIADQIRKPRSIKDVKYILNYVGWSDEIFISKEDYEILRKILSRAGYSIDDKGLYVVPTDEVGRFLSKKRLVP